jgi:hypothetical protein
VISTGQLREDKLLKRIADKPLDRPATKELGSGSMSVDKFSADKVAFARQKRSRSKVNIDKPSALLR